MRNVIFVSSSDTAYFNLLKQAILSLKDSNKDVVYKIGIIDAGLENDEKSFLISIGCTVVSKYNLPITLSENDRKYSGLVARMLMRDIFPGYEYYFWFDSDMWFQTSDFVKLYIESAELHGASVALENGFGQFTAIKNFKWFAGNMYRSFGWNFLRIICNKQFNIGAFCLKHDAPHWDAWKARYLQAYQKTGKVNMDQHAFQAAVVLDRLPIAYLSPIYNWQPCLLTPYWDSTQKLFCTPNQAAQPISVIHLTGDKSKSYCFKSIFENGYLESKMDYNSYLTLKK
jgi:lipopolysaccharide biosynthesis glycosyltransferase